MTPLLKTWSVLFSLITKSKVITRALQYSAQNCQPLPALTLCLTFHQPLSFSARPPPSSFLILKHFRLRVRVRIRVPQWTSSLLTLLRICFPKYPHDLPYSFIQILVQRSLCKKILIILSKNRTTCCFFSPFSYLYFLLITSFHLDCYYFVSVTVLPTLSQHGVSDMRAETAPAHSLLYFSC